MLKANVPPSWVKDCRNEMVPSREGYNGFESERRAIPPLRDDPNYR